MDKGIMKLLSFPKATRSLNCKIIIIIKRFLNKAAGLLAVLLLIGGCRSEQEPDPPAAITYATASDFADTAEVSVQLAEGFRLDLWAPGPLLSNAVALSFDPRGVAYVAETSRRKSSDIDIRSHPDWMTEDLALQTIEDTEAFHRKKLDPALSEQNTWQEDLNNDGIRDWRDLEVQTEYIRRIWDSDGDGRADASGLFADGFNTMVTGVAAGVLYHQGDVFLTVAPDVWRLTDSDNDGKADRRKSISYGYGIHIAYAGHDMSGLTTGPDGKIYWSIGDLGVNVTDAAGKRWVYPNQGAVMRANPDGSDFEVFAHGLRNPQELAFDAYGNLISVDNDGDHPGEHERFVHIIEGSDSGWRINWQFGKYDEPNEFYKVWMDEKLHVPHFPGQAAYLLPPLALAPDGPAGLAYNPGTALSQQWNDHFFASYFTGSSAKSRIQAFKLEPKGASFRVAKTVDILTGIVPTGVDFGPDGALYINDWKDGYDKKPQGRIWKLDVQRTAANKDRDATRQILKNGMDTQAPENLTEFLGHPDMRVRLAAQFEMVKRGEKERLLEAAANSKYEFARLHGIWGMGQLARKDQAEAAGLLPLLSDRNSNVRAQTAKVLGEAGYAPAFEKLLAQVADSSARARFFAIEALGKLGDQRAFPALVDQLAEVQERDPHLRHTIIYALSRLKDEKRLADLSEHPSKFVRIGAVVALRHLQSPLVASFLSDRDPLVVTETARAIHDDFSIPAALPALAEALSRTDIREEAFVRRAINANLRLGDAASARRLVAFAANEAAETAMRTDALWALGYWSAPPVLDRVDGRYRGTIHTQLADAHQAIDPYIKSFLGSRTEEIRAGAASVAGRLGYSVVEPDLFRMVKNRAQPVNVRKPALDALAALKSRNLVAALDDALTDSHLELRKEAQSLIGELDLPDTTVVSMLTKVLANGSIPEQQQALSSLGKLSSAGAASLLGRWLDSLTEGKVDPALELDVLLAIENSNYEQLKVKKAQYESSKPAGDALAAFKESMYGGDVDRGQRIFYRNNSAQCIRCHVIQNLGGAVGPDLTRIGAVLTPQQLLASMVDPSARLAPGYGSAVINLKDGQKVTGIIQEENENFLMIQEASGSIKQLAVSEISQRQNLPSAMPSMQELLTKRDIRDLMAFLMTLK